MRKRSIFWQILLSFIAVSIVLVAGMGSFFIYMLEKSYYSTVEENLYAQARVVETRVEPYLKDRSFSAVESMCQELKGAVKARITIVLEDGTVVGDSFEEPSVMDNHRDRPEILAAVKSENRGMSIRYSRTLGIDMMYVAVPLIVDETVVGVVRTSMPLTLLRENYRAIRSRIILAAFATLLIAVLLSLFISHSIWKPLREMRKAADHFATGDFNLRVPLNSSLEVSALADSMNWMAAQLDEKISTIRQQQFEQEAIISSMAEGVIALDTKNMIIGLNQAAAEMMDTTIRNGVGKVLEEVSRHQMLYELVKQVQRSHETVEADITLYEHEAMRYLQVRTTSLKGSDGRVIGVLLVLNDVTRLRKLENMRREFVANVSHELKTPVTSIKGFVETLLDNEEDAETTQRFLAIVSKQTDRLNAIIEDLLNLSRIERDSEHGDICFGMSSMLQTIDSALLTCQNEAERNQVTIRTVCENDVSLLMNAELVEQALVNLVGNAIKYSNVMTTVTVRVESDREHVRIHVSDEGPGIAHEHLPRLFERFYRVDKNRSRKMGGTGLGLAIVKHIVRSHHGEIDVESELGKGSTFTITLPRKQA